MYFAKEFSIMLIANPSSLDAYPEGCVSVSRTHSCGRVHRHLAKDLCFAKAFRGSHALSFVVETVKGKLFPKLCCT